MVEARIIIVTSIQMNVDKTIHAFGGRILKLSHESTAVKTTMKLNVFLPPRPQGAPVLFFLAGLTCTGDNALEKGCFLGPAAEHNIALVFPDTSPRTASELKSQTVSEHQDWDFGSGAGFYLNATEKPWAENYRMDSYVHEELTQVLSGQFSELNWQKKSVMGHSMGGFGALSMYLNHYGSFLSVSAFAPISHPTECPWGQKAFTNYLGSTEAGKKIDPTEVVKGKAFEGDVLIDVGLADDFYKAGQLLPEDFAKAAEGSGLKVNLRKHEGYDHSYFFVSTFARDHIEHHARILNKA